jgi:hypothetical protein
VPRHFYPVQSIIYQCGRNRRSVGADHVRSFVRLLRHRHRSHRDGVRRSSGTLKMAFFPCIDLPRRGTTGPSCTTASGDNRPVITRRVRSGQTSRWRSEPMRPLTTYSLLWWPPGRAYLVRDLPKDRPWCCFDMWFSLVFEFVGPVVRGASDSPWVLCTCQKGMRVSLV